MSNENQIKIYSSLSVIQFLKKLNEEIRLNGFDGKIIMLGYRLRCFAKYSKSNIIIKFLFLVVGKIFSFSNKILCLVNINVETQIGWNCEIIHGNGIFISPKCIIGKNARILHQVTIGSNNGHDGTDHIAATIGDNIFIGAGAKIIGNISLGNNIKVGANAVVSKDVPDNHTVLEFNKSFLTKRKIME